MANINSYVEWLDSQIKALENARRHALEFAAGQPAVEPAYQQDKEKPLVTIKKGVTKLVGVKKKTDQAAYRNLVKKTLFAKGPLTSAAICEENGLEGKDKQLIWDALYTMKRTGAVTQDETTKVYSLL